ncbi:hypothetical protein F5Y15DRAFT_417808 [Xylariaceae sp. FL0016]|nr:hypothetical protein F5Y15DRAFT_417808 [Xylariaceae sp. FL0016]
MLIFFNKSNLALPFINVPFKKVGQGPALERIRSKLFATPSPGLKGRQICLASWPSHVDENGQIHFKDNGSPEYQHMKNEIICPDVAILATGYRQDFPFFKDQDVSHGGKPYPKPETADVRHIWSQDDPTVAFIGFLRPQIGAIPTVSEMQAMLWVTKLIQQLQPSIPMSSLSCRSLPELRQTEQWHYMLTRDADDRITYGIDHDSYVHQLACDLGCAPSIVDLLRISWARGWRNGWNIIPAWAFTSQINTKFRLRGPWYWEGAADVLHGEIWTLVERNGGFTGLSLQTAVPFMMLGLMSLVCWVYASILGLFGIHARGPYTPKERFEMRFVHGK